VRGLAVHLDDEPVRGVAVRHDPDINLFLVQQGALFDVELEIGVELAAADRRRARVADARQLVAEAPALVIAPVEHPVELVDPGEGAGRDHRRREARAFLVGPVHDFDRATRAQLSVVQAANHLQAGEHANDAVVAPAVHLRIEMAADGDRRQAGVLALPSCKYVPDCVHGQGAAGLAAPGDELVAHLAIGVGKRDAGETAGAADADPGGALDRAPVALGVDRQIHPALRKRQNSTRSIETIANTASG
jgi:hypothetical protein